MRKKQGKSRYMAIKIDLEKAYDGLKWSLIRGTLMKMQIPIPLIEIIMMCVTSSKMRELWNSQPTKEFVPSRLIREGCFLSPYLFVICMDRLNQIIEEAIAKSIGNRLDVLDMGLCYRISFLEMTSFCSVKPQGNKLPLFENVLTNFVMHQDNDYRSKSLEFKSLLILMSMKCTESVINWVSL